MVAEWYEGLGAKDKASVLVKLEYLIAQPRENWIRPRFDLLHGTASGLGEIILKKVGMVQTRLIGYFDGARSVFTIVLIVTKKGKQFNPKEWEAVAQDRKKDIQTNPEKANDWNP